MAIEQTLILIKPDGAFRKLTGLTIDRLDATGLEMVGAKMIVVADKLARAPLRRPQGQAVLRGSDQVHPRRLSRHQGQPHPRPRLPRRERDQGRARRRRRDEPGGCRPRHDPRLVRPP